MYKTSDKIKNMKVCVGGYPGRFWNLHDLGNVDMGDEKPWSEKTMFQRINKAREQLRKRFDQLKVSRETEPKDFPTNRHLMEGQMHQIIADDTMLNSILRNREM